MNKRNCDKQKKSGIYRVEDRGGLVVSACNLRAAGSKIDSRSRYQRLLVLNPRKCTVVIFLQETD